MKVPFLIPFLALIGVLLVGCQGQKQTIVKDFIQGEGRPPEPKSEHVGGVDGGGGNGVNGRALESYRIEPGERPEFQSVMDSIVMPVMAKFPQLAADLAFVRNNRAWYLLPVSLNKIDAFKLGVYFPTDQIALQNTREIWIDDRIFSKMDPVDQVKLVVHELVMGVRLMEGANSLDQCLAQIEILNLRKNPSFKEEKSQCYKNFRGKSALEDSTGLSALPSLSGKDYEVIRQLTYLLTKHVDEVTGEETGIWMASNGFARYQTADRNRKIAVQ